MTNTNILQAMGQIDPELIADAAPDAVKKEPKLNPWVKWAALAAAFCLIVTVGVTGMLNKDVPNTPVCHKA